MTRRLQLAAVLLGGFATVHWAFAQPVAAQQSGAPKSQSGWKKLTGKAKEVIENGGTERAFTGALLKHKEKGNYTCNRCAAPLFTSSAKFNSGTGWPSFDSAIEGAVREVPDADGRRTEIRCARCGGHLGHVFRGERMNDKDTRHCVNSVALDFSDVPYKEAFFAGGCFWGVEHLLEKVPGVLRAESGYMGGTKRNPSYREVVGGTTGHAETVRVVYDPSKVTYRTLAKIFFEIHDPTQKDRQGPDIGTQYRSAVFVGDEEEERVVFELVELLRKKGYAVVSQVQPAGIFWPAEEYHQDYYIKTGKAPYCHSYTERF